MSQFNVPVEEYTTPNPVVLPENASLDELQSMMKQSGFRHIPIVSGGKVVGVVSDRDCRVAAGLNRDEKRLIQASDIMSPDPVTVSAADTLDKVAFEMSARKIGSVIVNDENDEFLGIFTVTDALNALIEIARESAPSIGEIEI